MSRAPRGQPEEPRRDGEERVIPIVEEELNVRKQPVERGRVRVRKVVRETEAVVNETLTQENVDVERVPVNRVVDSAPPIRYEGDTIIVPVLEEQLVVEKRLVLREELRITRRLSHRPEVRHVPLRKNDVIVERTDARQDYQDSTTESR